jgi:hypothetical protein
LRQVLHLQLLHLLALSKGVANPREAQAVLNVRKKVEAQVVLNVRKKGANVTKNAVNVVKSVVVMNDTTTTVVGMNMVKVNAGIE